MLGRALGCLVYLLLAAPFYGISYFHFREKGPLFNIPYLYASEEERNQMDQKPLYHQSSLVFCLIGSTLVLVSLQVATEWSWLTFLIAIAVLAIIVYIILSSIHIHKKTKV